MGYQRRVHGAFQSSCLWIDLCDCVREFIIATNPPCQRWSTYQKRDALSAASARNINPTRSRDKSTLSKMVNVPKTRRTFCGKCKKHQPHKVSQQIHLVKDGQRTKNETHFLRQVQETSTPQGLAVQEVQGTQVCSGTSALRQETGWIWWSDQAHLQKEG